MISMDTSLYNMYKNGKITSENAILFSINKELMQNKINTNIR